MLKERKLLQYDDMYKIGDLLYEKGNKTVIGWYIFNSYLGGLGVCVKEDATKPHYEGDEYYYTEFESEAYESDYHSYAQNYNFKGVYLAFNLNIPNTKKYFGIDLTNELLSKNDFLQGVEEILTRYNLIEKYDSHEVDIDYKWEHEGDGYHLKVVLLDKKLDETVLNCSQSILEYIRDYFDKLNIHITRMFGSYILVKNVNGTLTAVKATPIPIKYCPLMIKLLKEVGGPLADDLINSLKTSSPKEQTKNMCNLINEVIIKGGYFDTSRPLNSCEANVTFGASETLSSAFVSKLIDAAVIVSNNLGTIITTSNANTQGAVKRMTGLFYTSPSKEILNTAYDSGIIPVFPYTAEIDQLEGVRKAISLGYKNIAVTVAADDNQLLGEIKALARDGIKIYTFGLCSTGISKDTALIMQSNADVIWSCASKYVKELIEPKAIAQVGVKIPVHIMNEQGWKIVNNHLMLINTNKLEVDLDCGDEKPIILNQEGNLKLVRKKELHSCNDCPHPCI